MPVRKSIFQSLICRRFWPSLESHNLGFPNRAKFKICTHALRGVHPYKRKPSNLIFRSHAEMPLSLGSITFFVHLVRFYQLVKYAKNIYPNTHKSTCGKVQWLAKLKIFYSSPEFSFFFFFSRKINAEFFRFYCNWKYVQNCDSKIFFTASLSIPRIHSWSIFHYNHWCPLIQKIIPSPSY